ncbi:MAG: RnfABCDGE type electron transport complex subunit B [Candidatus Omnitrophica bacterium]|nr:RnfABCDGE type electron transport complex subunit B [Candidatus Omnitrophota bacterium]MDD5512674.1 RnfABCDGE type electron transport complex subunit B [Candidatus Omnitrophota bacterium]
MIILATILTLSGLGLIFGIGLAFASKKFCVVTDPRLEKVYNKLPGANCGACGSPGCMGFAEGLIHGSCSVNGCTVVKDNVRQEIAGILGVKAEKTVKTAAVLHCHGGKSRAKDKYVYQGVRDCIAANLLQQGPKACVYGCIGYGTCARICPFGAIKMGEDNLPVVDENKCTACGKCVAICPKQLFSLVEVTKSYAVRCRSLDLGKKVSDVCSVGCIACRRCEKACPVKAIKIIDNLSVIDYNICENHGECFKVCPTSSIARKEKTVWSNKK